MVMALALSASAAHGMAQAASPNNMPPASACDTASVAVDDGKRKKVAVVLSGGGAKAWRISAC